MSQRLEGKFWKSSQKVVMDEKSCGTFGKGNQNSVMNQELVQNSVMSEDMFQNSVMNEEMFQDIVMNEELVKNGVMKVYGIV